MPTPKDEWLLIGACAFFLSSEVVALGADVSPLEAMSVQLSTWLSETHDIPRALSCPISCQLPWAVGTVKCSQHGCAYQEADNPSSCQGSNWVFTMTKEEMASGYGLVEAQMEGL